MSSEITSSEISKHLNATREPDAAWVMLAVLAVMAPDVSVSVELLTTSEALVRRVTKDQDDEMSIRLFRKAEKSLLTALDTLSKLQLVRLSGTEVVISDTSQRAAGAAIASRSPYFAYEGIALAAHMIRPTLKELAAAKKPLDQLIPHVVAILGRLKSGVELKEQLSVIGEGFRHVVAISERAAGHFTALKDFETARRYRELALLVDESMLGSEDADVATDLAMLASINEQIGDKAAARAAYERCVQITEIALQNAIASPAATKPADFFTDALTDLQKQLRVHMTQGDLESAEHHDETKRLAMLIAEEASMAGNIYSPKVIRDSRNNELRAKLPEKLGVRYYNLGSLLNKMEDWPAARQAFARSVELAESTLLDSDPIKTKRYVSLAAAEKAVGDLTRARENYERAVQIGAATLEPKELGNTYGNLGELCENMKDYPAAKIAWSEALRLGETTLAANDWRIASRCAGLGVALFRTGDLVSALQYTERSVQISLALTPPSPLTTVRLNNLIFLNKSLKNVEGLRKAYDHMLNFETSKFGADSEQVAQRKKSMDADLLELGSENG